MTENNVRKASGFFGKWAEKVCLQNEKQDSKDQKKVNVKTCN